jgi:cyclase
VLETRVIPCLLLRNAGLVKTVRFRNPRYLGDPINIIKIFNAKEIHELFVLDITATVDRRPPGLDFLADLATECFMPLAYGGGLRDLETVRTILGLGVEKVVINTHAVERPAFVAEAAALAGSSSVVVSIDVKRSLLGRYEVMTRSGRESTGLDPVAHAKHMEELGAGEILLTSIDRDGTMKGYDVELISLVARAVSIPVVACGGAGSVADFGAAVRQGGASAVAAGSLFVFQGRHRAVLITYPTRRALQEVLA